MPRRRFPQEAFHMDHLRSSPSQQHLDPTSRSSSSSQQDNDDLEQDMAQGGLAAGLGPAGLMGSVLGAGELGAGQRAHKLDLYSIPVFLLESLLLAGLAYLAYFVHFQYKLKPMISGFYCDDSSLRQEFSETKLTKQFDHRDNEMTLIILLIVVPIVIISFCELVNSMFGSLKFRQIRSLCKCCKLHSITRRTLRFSAAFLLGFFIVMISCDILATSVGRFRPYFAKECRPVYDHCPSIDHECPKMQQPISAPSSTPDAFGTGLEMTRLPNSVPSLSPSMALNQSIDFPRPETSVTNATSVGLMSNPIASSPANLEPAPIDRIKRDTSSSSRSHVLARKWVDLTGSDLNQVCQDQDTVDEKKRFESLAFSWPSFPGAIIAYPCFYLACYLSFVGTARPFRLITSVLVISLILVAAVFNVQLVKDHYNHWEDVLCGSGLSGLVVIFILLVYLNMFRDTHYYENQKSSRSSSGRHRLSRATDSAGTPYKFGYANEAGQYHLDKVEGSHLGASAPVASTLAQNGTELGGSAVLYNDLPKRYFPIPRANYRGAPRPLSAMNRV